VVAISPQLPELNAEVKEKHRLAFPVLHDQDNSYARQLGIVYSLPADLSELYAGFGIDLPTNHGTATWEVPLATRMVVGTDGIIRSIDADPDYTIRPEPEASLEVLRSLG
jgi:peroxiredoxin